MERAWIHALSLWLCSFFLVFYIAFCNLPVLSLNTGTYATRKSPTTPILNLQGRMISGLYAGKGVNSGDDDIHAVNWRIHRY